MIRRFIMIKCFAGLVVGFVMFVGSANEVSAETCKGGVCNLAKAVVSVPVNVVKQAQPVKRLAAVPSRTSKWLSNRPVRSLVGRVRSRL